MAQQAGQRHAHDGFHSARLATSLPDLQVPMAINNKADTVTYMGVTYRRSEWERIMRPTHYQYRWGGMRSSKAVKSGSRPPPGAKGVTKEMREIVDLAIRDTR